MKMKSSGGRTKGQMVAQSKEELDNSVRSEILTVRVTPAEKAELIKTYGTASKALYAFVRAFTVKRGL